MKDETSPTSRPNPGAFGKGHRRFGGRRPGSMNKRTREAIEICLQHNFHPAAFLAAIAKTGMMPNPDGTTTPVSSEDRIRASVALCPYVMPKLQNVQQVVHKADPEDAVIDVNRLMESPELVAAAQALALAASSGQAIDVDAELSRLTPSRFTANPVPFKG